MPEMLAFLAAGFLLGLSGGLAPGPLLALVASETLRHGVAAGTRVALAPLLTDPPIILAAVLLLRPLVDQSLPLALVNLGGGLYLGWLGMRSVRFRGATLEPVDPTGALRRGIVANFLNPSPYLFWLAVGAPTVLTAWGSGWWAAGAFVGAFYALLVGCKVLLALGLSRVRHVLCSSGYIYLIRGLGLWLLAYALWFLGEGGRLLLAVARAAG